jgi:hypothetical protein
MITHLLMSIMFNDKLEDTSAPENLLHWSEAIFQVYQMLATRRQQSSVRDIDPDYR